MTEAEEAARWLWPRYNLPGLLIGPLKHVTYDGKTWAIDYSQPGAIQRMTVEVDFIEDMVVRL